jgi:tetratricopeptide (TPR) repeat protein
MPRAVALTLLVALVAAPVHRAAEGDPRTVVDSATAAVRAGTDARLRSAWRGASTGADTARDAILGLATIERLTYDYDGAARHYQQLFVPAGTAVNRHDMLARIGLGIGLEAQGESGERVDTLYRRALVIARTIGDSTDIGEALYRIGSLLAPYGGNAAGLAYLDSAVMMLPSSAPHLRAIARCRRAQYSVGTLRAGAADTLAAAVVAARETGDPDALGYCLRAQSVLHRFHDQSDSASASERELIELRRRTHDRSGLSVALVVHADHIRAEGRFGESMQLFREALEEAKASKNQFIEATVALGLGGTALTMNDHAAASEYIERAIGSFEALNDSASLMLALSYRPFVSMTAGDLAAARAQTAPVIAYWRKHGDYDHLTELYRQLAAIEIRAGNDSAAERALNDAMASAAHIGSGERGGVEYDRGRLALRRGDADAAERGFRRYLAELDSTERLPRYEGRVRLAEVCVRRGELDRAERELFAAGADLDAWRATLADPELRLLAFQASAFEVNDRNASLATVLAALAAGGRATAAFELAEHRRARELAERMARTSALHEAPTSATRRAAGAEATTGSGMASGRALSVTDIGRAIPDDSTALLEFVTAPGGAPTTLFIVTRRAAQRGEVASHRLPPADSLVGEIARLVALIESGENPEALERDLARAVLHPALAAAGPAVTKLVIVPDGPLHRMPWDVLRLTDGRYAAEQYTIGIVPSAAIAARLWSAAARPRRGAGARVLAFGDPEFARTAAVKAGDETYRSGLEATGGLPRLPQSAREARLVASYGADAELRLGPDATAAYLKHTPLASFDVVHFATHALIDERVATRSVLALGASDGESGFVGAADLAALDLDASLVVLSACRSAGGVVVDGEGIQGLTAPLLQAGARSVVATTWRISDRATVPFVEAFYDAMADGLPVASALRAAKLDAIRRGAPPREWAAFNVVGDPFVRIGLVEPPARPRWLLIVPVLLLLLLGGVAIAGMRRRGARRRVSPAGG